MIDLHLATCPDCEAVGTMELNQWQTANGVYGAVVTFCSSCSTLRIHRFNQGTILHVKENGDA